MTHKSPPHERGTLESYVIGFILSLVFTFIPYYLVVNKVLAGNILLGTILGFAMLQMVVQLLFFLHLGRERNPRWQSGFLVATVGAVSVVIVGSIWIMYHLHHNMTPMDKSAKAINDENIYQIGGQKTGACEAIGVHHHVTIKDGVVTPSHTDAKRCDTLTITSEDEQMRHIAFGPHDHHQAYAGEEMLMLMPGHNSKVITLSETGTVSFHDHLQEETAGSFTVEP